MADRSIRHFFLLVVHHPVMMMCNLMVVFMMDGLMRLGHGRSCHCNQYQYRQKDLLAHMFFIFGLKRLVKTFWRREPYSP